MAPSQRRQQRYAASDYAYNDDEHHLFSPFAFDTSSPPLPVPVHVDAASYYFPPARAGAHGHGAGHGGAPSRLDQRPDSSRSMPKAGRHQKKLKHMASGSNQAMTGEEFDALPLAVRRKYFSTLERLRFAEGARSDAVHDRPRQRLRKGSLADRRGLDLPFLEPRRKSLRSRRGSGRTNSVSSSDASWFMTLPEKIRQRQFTREEQELLSGRLHDHYILDATDEAIYKAARGAHRQLTPLSSSPDEPTTPSSTRSCLDCDGPRFGERPAMADTVLESFRWMDEEGDLDLKLDDYHANLDGAVIPNLDSSRRPSFRRRLSISSMPFNNHSKRSPSIHSRPPKSPKYDPNHVRQRSRALSLMPPRHAPKMSVSSIDPSATHYQDPEARLKLRAYLASPQKFDEAIEFGFPSIDGVADDKENKPPRLSADIIGRMSHSTEKSRSFFWKDVEMSSLFDDDSSVQDPESPLTPRFADSLMRHQRGPSVPPKDGQASSDFTHLGLTKPMVIKQPDQYAHGATGNREMTLRMTLTRPDLRADDTTLYGWQNSRSPLRNEPLTLEESEVKAEVMHGPFGGIDGWGADEKENGVVKRIWNKVKSSQRKTII